MDLDLAVLVEVPASEQVGHESLQAHEAAAEAGAEAEGEEHPEESCRRGIDVGLAPPHVVGTPVGVEPPAVRQLRGGRRAGQTTSRRLQPRPARRAGGEGGAWGN